MLWTHPEKGGIPPDFRCSGNLLPSSSLYRKCSTCMKALKWLDEQLKLLATDGMLVKRPLVIGDDFVLTGFREKEWIEAMHV